MYEPDEDFEPEDFEPDEEEDGREGQDEYFY